MPVPAQNFISIVKVFIKKIYHTIPLKLRYKVSTFLWKCFHQLKRFFEPLYPQVFIFDGLEKNSLLPLTFAYVGPLSQTQEYWVQSALAPGFQKQLLGRHFCNSIVPLLKQTSLDCSFLLIECNPFTLGHFSKKPGFHIPRWVNMEIDISMPIEKLLGSERSEIQRKIRKYQLTYELTHEQKYLDDFYHNMYLPHIQARYKNTALINPPERFLEIMTNGELILIKKDEQTIAGGLLEFRGKDAFFRMLGIRDGNPQYVHWGAIGALYYFIILEMRQKGYKKIFIGGTRPLLSDGLTKFKKSLRASVIPHDTNARVWLKLLKKSPSLQDFLINNPFIFYKKDDTPHRAVFIEANEDFNQQELKDTLRLSACKGLEQTNLFVFGDLKNPLGHASALSEPSLSIQSARELFSD